MFPNIVPNADLETLLPQHTLVQQQDGDVLSLFCYWREVWGEAEMKGML